MADVIIVQMDREGVTKETVAGTESDIETLINAGWSIEGMSPSETGDFIVVLKK